MAENNKLRNLLAVTLAAALVVTGTAAGHYISESGEKGESNDTAYADTYDLKEFEDVIAYEVEEPSMSAKLLKNSNLSKLVKIKITNRGSKTLYVGCSGDNTCGFYMNTTWKNGMNVKESEKDTTGKLYYNGKYVKHRTVKPGQTKTITYKLKLKRTVKDTRGIGFCFTYDGMDYKAEANTAGRRHWEICTECGEPIEIGDIIDPFRPETPVFTREYVELTPAQYDSSAAIEDASIRLFRDTVISDAKSGSSAMISPLSVFMMMGMAEEGAQGETLAQMEKAFGLSRNDMAEWLKIYRESITSGSYTKVNVADSFWYRAGLNPKDAFKDRLKNLYNAETFESGFGPETVEQINGWVKKETYGMIPKLIDNLTEDNMAVLINAVAFDANWMIDYEDFQVKENQKFTREDGTVDNVTMLNSMEHVYLKDDKAVGTMKDYKEGFSFVAIQPVEGVSVADYLSIMTGESFRSLLESAEYGCDVTTRIPEFKHEYSNSDMVKILRGMGINDVFSSEKSNLSGIADQKLFISTVIHKTFIELNREGTKAAAVTGGIVNATSIPVQKNHYTVELNRPFIYAIIDSNTQMPIFIGTVMNIK